MPALPKPPADSREANTWLQVDNSAKISPSASSPGFDSVNASAAGVGVRNMAPDETAPLFAPSKAKTSQLGVLKEGTYLPLGGFGTGGVVNVGQMGSPQANAIVSSNPNFSGAPTMYPVQQSIGQDIFGDTSELIKRRDTLQANMDAFFAKNPLGNDLMANFHSIASQANQRKEIKEIGDRLAKRDELMAGLMGHVIQGQNQMGVQGLQNAGQLQNTALSNQGHLTTQNLVGQQAMDRLGVEVRAQKENTMQQHANAVSLQAQQDAAAGERNRANNETTLAAAAKPYDFGKNQTDMAKALMDNLFGENAANMTDEQKSQFMEMLKTFMTQSTNTAFPGTATPLPLK